MITRLPDPQSAREWGNEQRAAGKTIGFVPTMGALHAGHLSLVERAVSENDVTCVSIFVNPLQFNDPKDLEKYPRDTERDIDMLEAVGCDMVFMGTLQSFFPEIENTDNIVKLSAGKFGIGLEGEHRPGHFEGVRTIVDRLFKTVGDCRAYFGAKDFQQSLIVKDLASELGYPKIVVCPIVREEDGLAMSSRNVLLGEQERQKANCLYLALSEAKQAWQSGERDADRLRKIMTAQLEATGVAIEYADLRDPDNWQITSPKGKLQRAHALIAVKLGNVRLIDNMRLDTVD